ncbi:MAG: polyprenyl synthetase family protein [Acidimicrobiales bacterium]
MNGPATAAPPPAWLAGLADAVEGCLASTLDAEVERWSAVDPDFEGPLRALRSVVLAGGKRVRPAFCHWAFVGVGGDPEEAGVRRAGAALEMVHAFALLHDDVMDNSPWRHGAATLHVDYASRHHRAGWRGDSARFGEAAAILLGDVVHVYGDKLLADAPLAARQVFNELRLEVNLGQYLDLLGAARGWADAEHARRICRYKTAKYTIERPLHLGVALARPGRLAELAGPLSAYGLPLGEAFQLTDDLLGVFGDPALTGKPTGGDLREGKPTLLVALAREAATGVDRAFLDERYGAADLTDEEVVAMQALFSASGAASEATGIIGGLLDEALTAAEALPLAVEARSALVELAHFVVARSY